MALDRIKSLLVLGFSAFVLLFSNIARAQDEGNGNGDDVPQMEDHKGGAAKFDANEVIFGHVMDAHEFHFFSYHGADGEEHHATIPLPVILYAPEKGWSVFSSSKFHHGEEPYEGYRIITQHYKENLKAAGMPEDAIRLFSNEHIYAVNANGEEDHHQAPTEPVIV